MEYLLLPKNPHFTLISFTNWEMKSWGPKATTRSHLEDPEKPLAPGPGLRSGFYYFVFLETGTQVAQAGPDQVSSLFPG